MEEVSMASLRLSNPLRFDRRKTGGAPYLCLAGHQKSSTSGIAVPVELFFSSSLIISLQYGVQFLQLRLHGRAQLLEQSGIVRRIVRDPF